MMSPKSSNSNVMIIGNYCHNNANKTGNASVIGNHYSNNNTHNFNYSQSGGNCNNLYASSSGNLHNVGHNVPHNMSHNVSHNISHNTSQLLKASKSATSFSATATPKSKVKKPNTNNNIK
jgi:hypothetical protein